MTKLRANKVKRKLENGEVAFCLQGELTPDLVEFFGPIGFDGIWIEAEHGPIDFADIRDFTRAADLWGLTSIARVNLNLPGVIYRTLDLGAQGIVVPHVNTADEARAVVNASKFAPIGSRGSYTSRQGIGVEDYFQNANDEVLTMILIEDIIAIENLDEILKIDNIDVFFVAPGDLAQSMGYFGDMAHPEVQNMVDLTIGRIVSSGRVAGALVTDNSVESYIKKGARFVSTTYTGWLQQSAKSYLNRAYSAIDKL